MISIYQTQHAVPLICPQQCVKSSLGVDPKVYKEVSVWSSSIRHDTGFKPVQTECEWNVFLLDDAVFTDPLVWHLNSDQQLK